jgi:hypothetical protein
VEQAIDAGAPREGRVVVGYAGSMGEPNALDVLLDAAAPASGTTAHMRHGCGDGHCRAAPGPARGAGGPGPRGACCRPSRRRRSPPSWQAIDIAYIGWQRQPLYRFGIAPNKLMDYMMAARAVLHAVEAGNDPVAESGCGLTVPPEDPQAVAQGLRQLAALTPRAAPRARRARVAPVCSPTTPTRCWRGASCRCCE